MATLESTQFVQFAFAPSNPPFRDRNTLWSSEPSYSIPSLNASGSQRIHKPARAEDDDLLSLEEQSRATLRPNISTKTSNAGSTLQHLKQPTLNRARLQVDPTQSGLGGHQSGSRDQPMMLDDDYSNKAEGASGDVDTERIERDPSLHNTFATSELASGPTKSINASGPWYDVEEGCYIEEPAPGPCEQQCVASAPTQAQPQTPQSSTPIQDQTNQQGVDDITRSTSVESALYSLPKPFDSGDDGWTDENMAELEKELGLALEEQENSSASTPTSSRPRSVEAPQDEIQSRERTGTTGSRPGELQHTSRHGIAEGREEWEQWETEVMEGGGVAMQEQEELVAQKEETPMGDQQDLVEIVDVDDPKDKEATEALLATQTGIPKIDEHRFRLRGIRTQPLAGRQTKTTQYQVVWGERPNRSDFWVNEDDVRMSMLRPPCERSSQDLVPPIERDVMRVHRIRRKGKKIFKYLVDKSRWITEDQLRISLSPMLVAEFKASSTYSLSQAWPEVHLRPSATPISDEHRHASRASRDSSTPVDLALAGEPAARKRGHQDMHPEISSETHHSVNTNGNHNTCDTGEEDPRPAKRQKLRSTPARTTPSCLQQSPPLASPSTASLEIDDAQPQVNHKCSSTFIDDEHHDTRRTSRSPPTSANLAPIAKYQEWPFQGFFKLIKIGNETTYNLEFQLSQVPEHLHLSIFPKALGMQSNMKMSAEVADSRDGGAHSKIHSVAAPPRIKRVRWTLEEDATILKMREVDGCSWEEIHAALPHRTPGAIQVQYSTKLKK